jgi:hypothetical protein
LHWSQVNLPDGSYRWVVIKTYTWRGSLTNAALIDALVAHPTFRDHYCAPGEESEVDEPVHGPYRLAAVRAEQFTPTTYDAAVDQLDAWLRDSLDVANSVEAENLAIANALAPARALLAGGDAWYYLPDLGKGAQHGWGWGWVLWFFREWLVIQHSSRSLHSIACGLD